MCIIQGWFQGGGGVFRETLYIQYFINMVLYTGYADLLNFDRAELITMGSWYYALHGSLWEQNSIFAAV